MTEDNDQIDINEAAARAYLDAVRTKVLIEYKNQADRPVFVQQKGDIYNRIYKILNSAQPHFSSDNISYQELYTELHQLARELTQDESNDFVLQAFHKNFFLALYDPGIDITNSFHEIIALKENDGSGLSYQKQLEINLGNKVKNGLYKEDGEKKGIRELSSDHPESGYEKFINGVLGIDYDPLLKTNIPYTYIGYQGSASRDNNYPTCLRIGAQVHQSYGAVSINEQFIQYLKIKHENSKNEDLDLKEYTHVYFNLMKLDQGVRVKDFERNAEVKRSKALHALEEEQGLGVAVVNLPADNNWFFKGFDRKNIQIKKANKNDRTSLNELIKEIASSIYHNTNDFYMSSAVKEKCFGGTEENIKAVIEHMVQKSAKEILGYKEDKNILLDPSERHALLFHVIKHDLTQHMIQQLQVDSFNISCKDAIDRGGVHMLWDAFMKRIEDGYPMEKQEFSQLADSLAILVKGRPLNSHRGSLWNVLNQYYKNNLENKMDDSHPLFWVKSWLDDNNPNATMEFNVSFSLDDNNKDRDLLSSIKEKVNSDNVKTEISFFNRLNRLFNRSYQITLIDQDKKEQIATAITTKEGKKFFVASELLLKEMVEIKNDENKKYLSQGDNDFKLEDDMHKINNILHIDALKHDNEINLTQDKSFDNRRDNNTNNREKNDLAKKNTQEVYQLFSSCVMAMSKEMHELYSLSKDESDKNIKKLMKEIDSTAELITLANQTGKINNTNINDIDTNLYLSIIQDLSLNIKKTSLNSHLQMTKLLNIFEEYSNKMKSVLERREYKFDELEIMASVDNFDSEQKKQNFGQKLFDIESCYEQINAGENERSPSVIPLSIREPSSIIESQQENNHELFVEIETIPMHGSNLPLDKSILDVISNNCDQHMDLHFKFLESSNDFKSAIVSRTIHENLTQEIKIDETKDSSLKFSANLTANIVGSIIEDISTIIEEYMKPNALEQEEPSVATIHCDDYEVALQTAERLMQVDGITIKFSTTTLDMLRNYANEDNSISERLATLEIPVFESKSSTKSKP